MFNLLVKTMKKIFYIILTLIFSFQFITAQNISSGEVGKKYDIISGFDLVDDFFVTSFEKANWDKYRYEDNRRTLVFDNGVVIELLSASELSESGIPFDQSKIIPKGVVKPISESKFTINKNGHIIELHTYNLKK